MLLNLSITVALNGFVLKYQVKTGNDATVSSTDIYVQKKDVIDRVKELLNLT